MTKKQMIKEIVTVISDKRSQEEDVKYISQKDAADVVEALEEVVVAALTENRKEKIALGRLGAFQVKTVAARKGKVLLGENKGGEWTKPAHDEIYFKMSKSVRELA